MLKHLPKSFKFCQHIIVQKRFSTSIFDPRMDCLNYPCVTKHECKKIGCCKQMQESTSSSSDQSPFDTTNIILELTNNNLGCTKQNPTQYTNTNITNVTSNELSIVDTIVETVSDVTSSTVSTVSDIVDSISN